VARDHNHQNPKEVYALDKTVRPSVQKIIVYHTKNTVLDALSQAKAKAANSDPPEHRHLNIKRNHNNSHFIFTIFLTKYLLINELLASSHVFPTVAKVSNAKN